MARLSNLSLDNLETPILFRGDAFHAYRDPAALYHEGVFYLFCTLVELQPDGRPFSYLAMSASRDLIRWTELRRLTAADRSLSYCSPGSIVRYQDEWIVCICSYPRPNGEKYGNDAARLFKMRSRDLESWSAPEILRVKGPGVREEDMGRMIDSFIVKDKDDPAKWWCFYKQNGVSLSWTRDMEDWTFFGSANAGENACVIVDNGEYVLFHSPDNGIAVSRSKDLTNWMHEDLILLGARDWDWARGRLTAGFVLDLRDRPEIGKFLMFFHGSGPEDERTMFDNHASIGIAWSDDLRRWEWPEG